MIPFGERQFRRAVAEFVAHYHRERNHQGLRNQLIDGVARQEGRICRRPRLGGLLNYYERAAWIGGSAEEWDITRAPRFGPWPSCWATAGCEWSCGTRTCRQTTCRLKSACWIRRLRLPPRQRRPGGAKGQKKGNVPRSEISGRRKSSNFRRDWLLRLDSNQQPSG